MAVYVDQAAFPFRGEKWCHMWADSDDELLAFADRLGLRRSWHQTPPHASWSHFDLAPTRRARALRLGAIETDRYGPAEHIARRRGDSFTLASIASIRARKAARTASTLQTSLPLEDQTS